MFYFKAAAAQADGWEGGFAGLDVFASIYPGPVTKVEFQNGTTRTIHTEASVIGDFSGVTDGKSAYAKFCSGNLNSGAAASSSTQASSSIISTPAASPSVFGYPKPVAATNDGIVSGYFLDGDSSDVAVLSLLAMQSESSTEFQAAVQDFIADAKKAEKKKRRSWSSTSQPMVGATSCLDTTPFASSSLRHCMMAIHASGRVKPSEQWQSSL
jgi:hypothetical protein